MQFTLVPADRVERDWQRYAELLLPAIRQDPQGSVESVRRKLIEGGSLLFEVAGEASGLLVIDVGAEDGGLVGWIAYIAGLFEGRPKERLATMRAGLAEIENVMRAAGCAETRICGRDWSRVLPDYEPFSGRRNGLRKAL